MNEVLEIKNLSVSFDVGAGAVHAVRGVSLSMERGRLLALVGESGCGKSVTARAILRLNDAPNVRVRADALTLAGRDILSADEREMLEIRGILAGMIFQDPLSYLNPTMKVGRQITEALLRRGAMARAQCAGEAVRLLAQVQIPEPAVRAEQYPHEYSGGMRQRAMIAMALAQRPRLLIADEPTTALDPTIQLQILALLKGLQAETGTAILLITHDLSVVAHMADTVAVMYAGKIVEEADTADLFARPAHPYTRGLLRSLPHGDDSHVLYAIPGAPPDLYAPPRGCAFAPRCDACMRICLEEEPERLPVSEGHWASCWRWHPDCPEGGGLS